MLQGRPHRLGRLDRRCLKVLHGLDGKGENGFTMDRKSFVLLDADGLLSFEAFAKGSQKFLSTKTKGK